MRWFRPSSNLFTTGFDSQSDSRKMDRIWCRLYFRQKVSKHLARHHLDKSPLLVRALHCCKKNCFNSMCLGVTSRALALGHTQRCRGITTQDLLCVSSHSSLRHCIQTSMTQFHCCRRPMPSQAPKNAATISASPLLTIVECFFARRCDRGPKFASQP